MNSKIIVALDFSSKKDVFEFIDRVTPYECRLKVGKQLFTTLGPQLISELHLRGFDVFLDLKFHDIPNTVAKACQAAADLGVWMLNVHASGGRRMLDAASNAIHAFGDEKPLLIAVTVLTSLNQTQLTEMGINCSLDNFALKLAGLSQSCGLDGVVCAAHEAQTFKDALGQNFQLITPGIRLTDSAPDDQERVMTPAQALQAGSDYLVIGRPITQAQDPLAVLRMINQTISAF